MSRLAISVFAVLVLVLVAPAASADVTTSEVTIGHDVKDTIAAPPSKLCHPKKPITCRADDFSVMNVISDKAQKTASAWATAPVVGETKATAAPQVMAWTNDGRMCHGPVYMCLIEWFIS